MPRDERLGLDNQVFNGRVRSYNPRPVMYVKARKIINVKPKTIYTDHHNLLSNYQSIKSQETNKEEARKQVPLDTPNLSLPKKSKISLKYLKILPKNKKIGYALSIAAVSFIVIGASLSFYGFKTNKQAEAQAKSLSADNGGIKDNPTGGDYDETPVGDIGSYNVAPDMPRFIRIPSINIYARIFRVGVDNNNTVQAPRGIFDAGWYDGSAKPGEPGAMFIDGHVSGPTAEGVFYNIHKLKNGDVVEIERGDGHKLLYKVVATETFDSNSVDMNKVLRSYEKDKQGLNLMTCNGRFLPEAHSFNKRIVVYTVLQ